MSTFVAKVCRSRFTPIIRAVCRPNGADFVGFRPPNAVSAVRQLHVSSARDGSVGGGFHRTSDFDKKVLVWTKMYPDIGGVPEDVSITKMKKAKDMFRIRVSIMMALGTVVLCVVYIIAGKQAVGRGENISKQNRDRHIGYQRDNK
ncbi:UPF0389 protein GA21628-like [Littorina saxatilis]|uniref:Uncharacterized protein n=1 Tax=Littorina saxatilis TaxID=31220 RepID=A0AAN9BLM7_9CAEN